MIAAVFIVSHGIMGRIQEEFADIGLREELPHGEIVVQKAMGIMPGSWTQKRKDGKIAFRIRGCEHVEIIAEIVTVPVRIPTDVAIRLMVNTIAFAVTDPFFQAITGAGFPFTCSGINRSPDTRRIAGHETREDGVKIVLLQGRSPGSKRRDFGLHGKQIRAQHIRRKPRLWTEDRITILHELIDRRKVKVPEQLHDFPSGGIKGSTSIWIILTKLSQNTVLIGATHIFALMSTVFCGKCG